MPPVNNPRKGTHVKINPSRGYGDQMAKIISVNGSGSSQDLTLNHPTHGKFDIYTAHCYRDMECMRKDAPK